IAAAEGRADKAHDHRLGGFVAQARDRVLIDEEALAVGGLAPDVFQRLGIILHWVRSSASGSACDSATRVTARPLGSARATQPLSATTPPAPSWFTTTSDGCPGKCWVRY